MPGRVCGQIYMSTHILRPLLVIFLLALAGCGKGTQHDTSSSAAEANAAANPELEREAAIAAGTHSGNTGQGKGTDPSSTPILGMSGSPTGSAETPKQNDDEKSKSEK